MIEIQNLLVELKEEREKFTNSNTDRMKVICDRLVELGHYPEQSGIGYEPLQMVEAWGVDWNEFRLPHNCIHCNADLCERKNGPPFKREIGITGGPGPTIFICPDCREKI